MPTIGHELLTQTVRDIYVAKGVPLHEASIVARHQVAANLAGHDSHGVISTPAYVAQIDRGEIIPGAQFEVEQESATTAVVNGHWGFGFVVTERAMSLAMEKAQRHGVAAVTVRYQGHVGRLGAYATQAAQQNLIALLTADSGRGPKAVAPFGGADRRLGTNPICFGIPSGSDTPVVLDIATSSVAEGKIALARSRGEAIPLGWIVDRNGHSSTDPEAYYDGGALLPLGGDQGHKGYGLAFVVEVLCGLLTGLGYGVAGDGRHNDGNFMAVFDVTRFRDPDEFKNDVADFIAYLKATTPADGFDEVLYPGEIEQRLEAQRRLDGITIDDRTWSALEDLQSQLDLRPSRAPPPEC